MSTTSRGLSFARIAALSSVLLAPVASAAWAGQASADGYFTTAGAPLVSPTVNAGNAQATLELQRASDYFPTAGAPLVEPTEVRIDPASTVQKQQASGYFPTAGAPLVSATTEIH